MISAPGEGARGAQTAPAEMGVPRLVAALARHVPGPWLRRGAPTPTADWVYVDANAMYHPVAAESCGEGGLDMARFAAAMRRRLVELRDGAGASRLFVFGDGVAPRAKMMQQRRRRYMGMRDPEAVARRAETGFDSRQITPGTRASAEIARAVEDVCDELGGVFSGQDLPGEGEHKIFAHLGRARSRGRAPPRILVHGLDADLIVLSLLSEVPGIQLVREDDRRGEVAVVDVDALRAALVARCGAPRALCFALSLFGNDFLPRVPSMALSGEEDPTMVALLDALRDPACRPVHARDGPVDWEALRDLLERLPVGTPAGEQAAVEEANQRYLRRRPPADSDLAGAPRDPLAAAIRDRPDKWALEVLRRHARKVCGRRDEGRLLVQVARDYLIGLEWVYRYYATSGRVPWDWTFPHTFGPAVGALLTELDGGAPPPAVPVLDAPPAGDSTDFQLALVMPPDADVPPRVRALRERPELAWMFPRDWDTVYWCCARGWEGAPLLPLPDLRELRALAK